MPLAGELQPRLAGDQQAERDLALDGLQLPVCVARAHKGVGIRDRASRTSFRPIPLFKKSRIFITQPLAAYRCLLAATTATVDAARCGASERLPQILVAAKWIG